MAAAPGKRLLMALVGFLPATDPRMRSTTEAIARELTQDGLALRYLNDEGLNADGLVGDRPRSRRGLSHG
jgi:alpha,alpha-trehalase